MISAKNSVSEPPNLKFFWGRIGTRDNAPPSPRYKKPSYGPEKSN